MRRGKNRFGRVKKKRASHFNKNTLNQDTDSFCQIDKEFLEFKK